LQFFLNIPKNISVNTALKFHGNDTNKLTIQGIMSSKLSGQVFVMLKFRAFRRKTC